jgi:hypothetical protein
MDEPELIECNYCNTIHIKQCLIFCVLCLEHTCIDCRGINEKDMCYSCEYVVERYKENLKK